MVEGPSDDAGAGGPADPFAGAGPLGRALAAVDWEATPLGAPGTWPQSLTTAVGILLSSRFAMWLGWGPDLTFLCNETYRRDTLGAKYPWALGRPTATVWAEIWDDIGPRVERVVTTGEATWDEGLQLFLERHGYTEETYHTFSYSPLRDESGAIAGLLCVVSEDTEQVISERQMTTLRDLGARLTAARTEADVFEATRRSLNADPLSLPLTLTYLVDDDETSASLVCATGTSDGDPAVPARIDLAAVRTWPADAVLRGETTLLPLTSVLPGLPAGAWRVPPEQALVVPLTSQGRGRPTGFLVAALTPYRPLGDAYRGFVELVAGQVGAGIASARAYEAERRRAETLAELDRAKTAFFTNVSHELRTPLTLLLGPAGDALADRDEPLTGRQRRRVEIIQRNAKRLYKLVNTLLDFSRLEAGRSEARFERTDLGAYTAELAAMFETAVDAAGLTLTVVRPPAPAEVWVDREMWAKIVLNLLSNALKFTFTGSITVTVAEVRNHVELTVADTGIGIEAAQAARLFERFHQVRDVRSRSHEGSGIGLALVAELTAVHAGTVAVASVPGEGATFSVRIPTGTDHLPDEQVVTGPDTTGPADPTTTTLTASTTGSTTTGSTTTGSEAAVRLAESFVAETARWGADRPPDPEPAQPEPAGADPGSPAPGSGRPRVLVVDDNADMRAYIAGLLDADYDVTCAADGADALEAALAAPPDLVLTDVMMPVLDGFGLLDALAGHPATMAVPVVMLSARADDEATVDALEAGADDYLVKPFSARELLARVRANLELDRARRTQARLERSQTLLDQAERLAEIGSWEVDLAADTVTGSAEYFRIMGIDPDGDGPPSATATYAIVHPDDRRRVMEAVATLKASGAPLDHEFRIVPAGSAERVVRTRVVLERGAGGDCLRGSLQDVTDQHHAEEALRAAAAAQEAAAREHHIAEELQASLLPAPGFNPEHLSVASYYRAGVEGTQVGGDWYDVIELGAGRTALVLGDVMGRGVHAAAVMGQLRAAVRAYARLDLSPVDILEHLDGIVRDLGEDSIVTCVYAVYDPADGSLVYANAGHLPPLLVSPSAPLRRLRTAGPPLGTGPFPLTDEQVTLEPGALFLLYTDGLVERRDRDVGAGIDELSDTVAGLAVPVEDIPAALVAALVPEGVDDDIAVLVARRPDQRPAPTVTRQIPSVPRAVGEARHFVVAALADWSVDGRIAQDIVLASDELVTNAIVHGRSPVDVRLRRTPAHLFVEVHDGTRVLPQQRRPTESSEHGRGLQIVGRLADVWGTRPTPQGKAVWCRFALPAAAATD